MEVVIHIIYGIIILHNFLETTYDVFWQAFGLIVLASILFIPYLGYMYHIDPERPWYGYATRKSDNGLETWYVNYETRRDCMEQMKHLVGISPNNEFYNKPIGCVYAGNNYLLTYIINWIELGSNMRCMIRYTNNGEAPDYEPMLDYRGNIKSGDGWYCT